MAVPQPAAMIWAETYLDRPEQWDQLAGVLREHRDVGLDTEFHGLDVTKASCVGAAVVHVWSVAVRTPARSPLGHHRARGWVLPGAALVHPALRAVLEDPGVRKAVHNQPADDHAIHNHGVDLRGCINTLGLARWVWPGYATDGGFGLKNLMRVVLRREPITTFKELVSWERDVVDVTTKWREVRVCACGLVSCRKRKLPEHAKTMETESLEVQKPRKERGTYPLESIVPGHERWDRLVEYAAEDAVAALEVLEHAESQWAAPGVWPYGGSRPGFSQAVEDSVVLMERAGFPVDVAWCSAVVDKALLDEEEQLVWLHRWFTANATVEGPHRRDEVDAIWSSPKQLIAFFDTLGFPRSPVWKKGRVKPGDVKLDGTALDWIAAKDAGSRKLIGALIHLKRIRAGVKYLTKLRDSGGWVHPICGPAGDADDRSGAVTGRLAIKGVLEAQQLPTREEVDLYQVRKAIVAE